MANDTAITRSIRLTEKEVENFGLRLQGVLSKTLGKIIRRINAGNVKAKNAAQVLGSLWEILEKEGLSELLPEIRRIYGARLARLQTDLIERSGKTNIFANIDTKAIETLINFDVDRVTSTLKAHVDDTRAVLMRAVLTGEELDAEAITGRSESVVTSRVATELNTSVAMFDRTVTAEVGKELGFDLWEYLGPLPDKIIRDFCEACVTGEGSSEFNIPSNGVPIYTTEEVEAMDNEQGLPVMSAGGGYNCRHQWRPISEENARAMGWESK